MNSKSEYLINQIFFDKYKVIKKIGQGSFGRIYSCQDIKSNELYAMKVEQNSFQNNVLETESKYLAYLKGFGIPEIKYFGHSEKYHILIETLLDRSLENLFSESHGNFNLKDISMIGIQVLDRLEYIHSKNIIHRDIKPDNFVIGKNNNKNIIYMIDFGLAKKYRNSETLEHIPYRMTKRLTGTARFASVNALKGGEQSRKDDLESLTYMLLYFLRGSLPWQGVSGLTKGEKYKKIYYMKKNIGAEKMFENLPNEFKEFYLNVQKLKFEQEPDYNLYRKLFTDVIEKNVGEVYDNYFTWCKEINIINRNFFTGNNVSNNDETGKSQKSTKIVNMCNSNILLDKINNKKIKKISITFIDKKNKNKIINSAHNFYSLDKKRNKSLVVDNNYNFEQNDSDEENYEKKENKVIIVTDSNKSNDCDDEFSIEGEIEKNKKRNSKKASKKALNYKNKINILSLTKINKNKEYKFVNINKTKKNLNRTKTNRNLLNFSKKNYNFIMNNQIFNKTSRSRLSKNKSNESKSKSVNKIKQKNRTSCSNFYRDILNNSPGKINKTRNKIISVYNTHTNIQNKKKTKIKYSFNNLNKIRSKSKSKSKSNSSRSRNNKERSNKNIYILLEDFIMAKNNKDRVQINTSRTNDLKNFLKNMSRNGEKSSRMLSNPHKNNLTKDTSINNKTKNYKNQRNSNSKNNKCNSINNKKMKLKHIFSVNKSKRDIIININKCFKKNRNSNNQKISNNLNKIINRKNNIIDSKNSTINIESIVFVGDNKNNMQYSQKSFFKIKSRNKNNSRNKSKNKSKSKNASTPKNSCLKKNKNEKNNFLKKFKISILCNNTKYITSNDSKNKSSSKINKKVSENKKNNIKSKVADKKKYSKINKNIIYNYNIKKIGPLSFNNLISNVRTKKNININNNFLFNNSLIEKKFFMQSSFNSSDSNYILNNINNNNIIVNNFSKSNNNSNSYISKKLLNSFTINNKNIFPEEINENSINNNFIGFNNNSSSIIRDFINKNNNKNVKKKDYNSRHNIMDFIKRFHRNDINKENYNFKKQKIKK